MSPQFTTSVSTFLERIQFEIANPEGTWTPALHSQADRLLSGVVGRMKDFWTSLKSREKLLESENQVEILGFHFMAQAIRERMEQTRQTDLKAAWGLVDQEFLHWLTQNHLISVSAANQKRNEFLNVVEPHLKVADALIRTPQSWVFQWNAKENWEMKIGALDQSIRRYQKELQDGVTFLLQLKTALGAVTPAWPWTVEAITLLVRLGIIARSEGVWRTSTDPAVLAGLLHLPDKMSNPLQTKWLSAQKSPAEVQQRSLQYQQAIAEAGQLAAAGNFLQAEARMKTIPPTFRLDDQVPILEKITEFRHALNTQEALRQRVEQRDLQKLTWDEIRQRAKKFKAEIEERGWKGSEYANIALRHLEVIEKEIRVQTIQKAAKWVGVVAAMVLVATLIKVFLLPEKKPEVKWYSFQVISATREVTYQAYDESGNRVEIGADGRFKTETSGVYFVSFRKGKRAALVRVLLREPDEVVRLKEEKAFAAPYVKLTLLDATRKFELGPNEVTLLIDRVPMDLPLEGCYLETGSHEFYLRQNGQPDHRIPRMINQPEESIVLVSPWRPVTYRSNVRDLRLCVNNGNWRPIPARIFLPVGKHTMMIMDGRGDLRDSREVEVPLEPELKMEMNVPAGQLKLNFNPEVNGIQVQVNQEILPLQDMPWSLSGGTHQIKILYRGRVLASTEVEISVDELIEKTVEIQRNGTQGYQARFL